VCVVGVCGVCVCGVCVWCVCVCGVCVCGVCVCTTWRGVGGLPVTGVTYRHWWTCRVLHGT